MLRSRVGSFDFVSRVWKSLSSVFPTSCLGDDLNGELGADFGDAFVGDFGDAGEDFGAD